MNIHEQYCSNIQSRCQNHFGGRSDDCGLHPNCLEFEQAHRDPALLLWINFVTDENERMNAVDKIRYASVLWEDLIEPS